MDNNAILGRVLKMVFKEFGEWEDIVGLVLSSNGRHYTILKTNGEICTKSISTLESYSSVRLSPEVRELFSIYRKTYDKTQRKELDLIAIRNEIGTLNHEMSKLACQIRKEQGILEVEEFFHLLAAKLNETKNTNGWIFDLDPGSCVPYSTKSLYIYVYKEIEVVEPYRAKYTPLAFEEYDGCVFMHDDYKNTKEYKEYVKHYEKKFFNSLNIESLCYVNGKDGITFKCYQKVPYTGNLTIDLIDKIAKVK